MKRYPLFVALFMYNVLVSMECQKREELWNFLVQSYYMETYLRNTTPHCIPPLIYNNLLTLGVELPRAQGQAIDVMLFAKSIEHKHSELAKYFSPDEIKSTHAKVKLFLDVFR